MPEGILPAVAGLGLGLALAGAPGPVQAVLLTETLRGGTARGLQAMAGANLTFGVLLLSLALGLSLTAPSESAVRILKVVGGGFLVWLALDGMRVRADRERRVAARRGLPPAARGALAVLINPGAWLFLATAASSLITAAARVAGRGSAVLTALALLAGVAAGDGVVVVAGGLGLRRAGSKVGIRLQRGLAVGLAALGCWLVLSGLLG